MATSYPGADDVFTEPGAPSTTPLNSAGSGSRTHSEHHRDLGDAVEAIQANASLLTHDHSGSGPRATSKLAQANTHQSPDTDAGTSSLHHTIGTGANQGAAGNHTHTQATSHNSPDTDSATSSLHHTIGTSATQAAAGNHVHSHEVDVYFAASGTFTKASYPGLYGVEVQVMGGGGGSGGQTATDGSHWGFGTGGAGAGYAKAFILASNLTSSETVTIGAAGVAGVSGNSYNGGTGGTTSFGSHLSATGGEGGTAHQLSTGAAGGSFGLKSGGQPGGTYDVGVPGSDTGPIAFNSGPHILDSTGLSGFPAGGPYGQKKQETRGSDTGGVGSMGSAPGIGYGSGAKGCVSLTSAGAQNGDVGSPGLCIVRVIF